MRTIDADALYASIAKDTYILADRINSKDYGMFLIGIKEKIDNAPTIELSESAVSRNEYEALKRKWIEAEQRADYYDVDGDDIASGCVSTETKKWETCFSCPLSKGCPKIQGKSNDELEQYASEIPTDCPIAEPKRGEWIKWAEYVEDDLGVTTIPHWKCSICDTEYDPYTAVRMHYCSNCGAKMGETK